MNIWCISKYAAFPKYGAGARLFYLAKEFNKNGHATRLITSDANHLAKFPETRSRYNYENVEGLETIWIKTKKYRRTASISRILSWFDFEVGLFGLNCKDLPKPDIVLISSLSIFSIVYGWFLKKKYKSRLVFEIRDIWPLTMTEEGGFTRMHPLVIFIGMLERFGYRNADLIVGTMPKLDMHVEKVLGYSRPFFCCPLGFDRELMVEGYERENLTIGSHFPQNKFIVGYAGSMGLTNNLGAFIDCIHDLSGHENIHFVLVGDGDLREVYVKKLFGHNNVTFVPKIESRDVPSFLKRCDVLYLSTHKSIVWDYGQSMNKVVEYMYSGKPVILSYSGFPTMLNEANSGFFIEANDKDKLKQVLVNASGMSEGERRAMGLRGKIWIEKHRPYDKLAAEYLDALEKIL